MMAAKQKYLVAISSGQPADSLQVENFATVKAVGIDDAAIQRLRRAGYRLEAGRIFFAYVALKSRQRQVSGLPFWVDARKMIVGRDLAESEAADET
jgi:hypothetical protein